MQILVSTLDVTYVAYPKKAKLIYFLVLLIKEVYRNFNIVETFRTVRTEQGTCNATSSMTRAHR